VVKKRAIYAIISGLALFSLCLPAWAQSSNDKIARFFNKITEINKTQESLAGQVMSKAHDNLPVSTYANTVKWDDQANQRAVDKLAAENNVHLQPSTRIPIADEKLMNMSGTQFAKSYVDDEVRDQRQALQLYKQAATKFKDDTHV